MRAETARLARALRDRNDSQPPMSGVYPDDPAPVVIRGEKGERERLDMRWGMPSSKKALLDAASKRADRLRAKGQAADFQQLLRLGPDKRTTKSRNTASAHWKPWLGSNDRCLVPVTVFSEPDQVGGSLQPIWFALDGPQRSADTAVQTLPIRLTPTPTISSVGHGRPGP